jgi:hypothetical protein
MAEPQEAMPWEEYQTTPETGQGVVIPAAPEKPPAPKTTFRPMTPEEVAGQGLPAGAYQISSEGEIKPIAPSKSEAQTDADVKAAGAKKRAETIRAIMGRTTDLFTQDIEGQPLERLGGLTEYFSALPKNERFDAAAQSMLPLIRPLVAQSAKEGDSDKEMQVFMAYIPQASDSDIAIKEKLSLLEMLIGGMVDGKVPSQVTQEVAQTQAQAEGNTFSYGGKTYTKGETVIPSPSEPTPPAGPSMMDTIGTGLGRGLGDVVQGAGDVLGIVGNPLNATINAATGANLSTDLGQTLRTATGLPDNPDTMASAITRGGVSALTGSLLARGGAGLASGAMRSGLEMLGSTPGRDLAGGMGTAAGQQIAASQGAGTVGQIAAALAGGGLAAGAAGVRTPGTMAAGDRALVQAAEQNRVPLMTSDVMPPETFIGKSAQFTGERIPIAGTGGNRATQQEARVNAVKRIASEYGANEPALLDRISADLLATRGAELTKYATAKDEVITSLASAGEVPATNAARVIDEKIAELTRRGTPAAQDVVQYLTRLRTDIQGKSLDQIEAIRKDELSQAFKSGDTLAEVRSVGEKAVRPIYRALNEDMGDFIKGAGERRDFAKWKVANTRLAQMAGELDVSGLKQALRKGDVTPETVGNVLFSQKPSDVRALYGNLSANGKANARAAILARAIEKAGEKAGGLEEVSPQRFANEVARLGASTGVMFNGTDAARLSGLVKVLQATRRAGEAAVSTATGQQTYLPATLGALADVWGTGGAIVGSLATVGGLARAYESPAVRDIMLRLGRTKKGDKSEAFLVKRAITALAQQDNEQ